MKRSLSVTPEDARSSKVVAQPVNAWDALDSAPPSPDLDGQQILGPSCTKDCFLWPKHVVAKLIGVHGQDVLASNLNAKRGLLLSTTFSGLGSAELAAGMLLESLRDEGIVKPDFELQVYSACDKDPMCRAVLAQHDPATAPHHIFADVDDCFPQTVPWLTKTELSNLFLFIQWLNFKLFSWLGSRARARAFSVCFRTHQRRARARANPTKKQV